jgi:DNA-binding transcriptional MerR regulator
VEPAELTIDQLAAATGTTTRRIRALQTMGLLPHPELRGRTGRYGVAHRERLRTILRLQERGFSLESLGILFRALDEGTTLAGVLGLSERGLTADPVAPGEADTAELYGFDELQAPGPSLLRHPGPGRPLLSIVPTTMWDEREESEAS